ncbi:MAG TPA: hypothetical protein VFW65_10220 [Pseudonocardiaceae bacterium]|nr:hypothetical protein [Pseudonocardiaceae bacterium]
MGAHPGRIALEREIDEPQPRNVARFRATPKAQEHYLELWDSLEKQVTVSEVAADTQAGPS